MWLALAARAPTLRDSITLVADEVRAVLPLRVLIRAGDADQALVPPLRDRHLPGLTLRVVPEEVQCQRVHRVRLVQVPLAARAEAVHTSLNLWCRIPAKHVPD
jgi:hypothetical protein